MSQRLLRQTLVDSTTGEPPVRGDDLEITRRVTMPTGLVASVAWFTLKSVLSDSDPGDRQLEITTTETADGEIEDDGTSSGVAVLRFDFGGTDWTGIDAEVTYQYDIQVRSATGSISTPERGTVVFTQDVTLSTTP